MQSSPSSFEHFVTRHGSKTLTLWCLGLIAILYVLSAFMFMWGTLEIWQSFTFNEQQCQVKGHDVVKSMRGGYWKPTWTITALNKASRPVSEVDQTIIGSSSYSSTWQALQVAREKKIDRTYWCYRYQSYPLFGSEVQAWDKPTLLVASGYLLVFVVLFTVAIGLFRIRQQQQYQEQMEKKDANTKRSYSTLLSAAV